MTYKEMKMKLDNNVNIKKRKKQIEQLCGLN